MPLSRPRIQAIIDRVRARFPQVEILLEPGKPIHPMYERPHFQVTLKAPTTFTCFANGSEGEEGLEQFFAAEARELLETVADSAILDARVARAMTQSRGYDDLSDAIMHAPAAPALAAAVVPESLSEPPPRARSIWEHLIGT